MCGHRAEERAHGRDAERAEGEHEDETGQGARDVDVQEEREQRQNDRLHERQEQDVADELADVDGALVARREQQRFPAVVVALEHEAPAEPQERRQQDAEPQEPGHDRDEAFTVGAERELEHEEEQHREEQDGVDGLLRAPLDEDVFPDDGAAPSREAHDASSVWSA